MTKSPVEMALTGDAAPNWDAISFECPCSRCGYELRMLTQPRCPDCGLTLQNAERKRPQTSQICADEVSFFKSSAFIFCICGHNICVIAEA